MHFSFAVFKTDFLLVVSNSPAMMHFWLDFFVFILFGVCWASCLQTYVFVKSSAFNLPNIFFYLFYPSPLLECQLHTYWGPWYYLTLSDALFFKKNFPLFTSNNFYWAVITAALSLSFVMIIWLPSLSSEFLHFRICVLMFRIFHVVLSTVSTFLRGFLISLLTFSFTENIRTSLCVMETHTLLECLPHQFQNPFHSGVRLS